MWLDPRSEPSNAVCAGLSSSAEVGSWTTLHIKCMTFPSLSVRVNTEAQLLREFLWCRHLSTNESGWGFICPDHPQVVYRPPSIRQPFPNRFLGLSGLRAFPGPKGLLSESGDSGLPYRPSGLLIESGSRVLVLNFPR